MRTEATGFAINSPTARAQIFDPDVLPVWARYAKLRTQLQPYLAAAERTYDRTGLPLMRQLALAYPNDARAASTDDEYLLGTRRARRARARGRRDVAQALPAAGSLGGLLALGVGGQGRRAAAALPARARGRAHGVGGRARRPDPAIRARGCGAAAAARRRGDAQPLRRGRCAPERPAGAADVAGLASAGRARCLRRSPPTTRACGRACPATDRGRWRCASAAGGPSTSRSPSRSGRARCSSTASGGRSPTATGCCGRR